MLNFFDKKSAKIFNFLKKIYNSYFFLYFFIKKNTKNFISYLIHTFLESEKIQKCRTIPHRSDEFSAAAKRQL
jgi:hypothetical protein